jgi:hypothetical protein
MITIFPHELVHVTGGQAAGSTTTSAEVDVSKEGLKAKGSQSTGGEPNPYLRCMKNEAANCGVIQSPQSCKDQRLEICKPLIGTKD